MTTELIVFDLDGTLVDSRRDIADSANAVLEECGVPPHSEEAIGEMVGDGAAMLIARAFEAAHAPMPADALDRFLRIYDGRLLRFTRPYDGIPALLAALETRYWLAVLTNKPLGATRAILDGVHLASYFGDRVLGGDGPQPRKPDPSGLLNLVDRASVPAGRTMMVGDSHVDLRTAHAAGARAGIARYGFGFRDTMLEELDPDDVLIDHPHDLLTFL
jgi:phosphoglycolate phosphatase